MRRLLTYLLLLTSFGAYAQRVVYPEPVPRIYPIPEDGCTDTGAEAIWLMENDATDENGDYDLTANSVTYGTSPTPPEGTYYANLNGTRYFDVPTMDRTSTWTFACEVYMGTSASYVWSNREGSDAGYEGFTVYINGSGDDIYLLTSDGTTVNNASALDCAVPSYSFFSLIVTYDDGDVAIYLDGTDETDDSTASADFDTSGTSRIGSKMGTAGSYLYGHIDAVQIYTRVLDATEISDIVSTPGEEQIKCL